VNEPRFRTLHERSFKLLKAALIVVLVNSALFLLGWFVPAAERVLDYVCTGLFLVASLLFVLTFFTSISAIAANREANVRGQDLFDLWVGPFFVGGFFTAIAVFVTLIGTRVIPLGHGRAIRKRGRAQLAQLGAGGDWSRLELAPVAPQELRAQLATRWRENGRAEHASVAAFARLSLQLLQLGAPARLVEDANRDSLDEIRHAEICFSMGRALDGRDLGPSRFPAVRASRPVFRKLALVRLAVESLLDGALSEGVAARVLSRLAKTCEDAVTREIVAGLARDEGRHAAHAREVIEWCVAEGGAPVERALRGALRAIPDRAASDDSVAWEKFGLDGGALEAEEYEKARSALMARSFV
jgi:hypothetical protein